MQSGISDKTVDNLYCQSTYNLPGIILTTLPVSFHLMFINTTQGPHVHSFIHEETASERFN